MIVFQERRERENMVEVRPLITRSETVRLEEMRNDMCANGLCAEACHLTELSSVQS